MSVSLKRELDFQGLVGFGSAYFVLFFGYGFWMALGMNFYRFWGAFGDPF